MRINPLFIIALATTLNVVAAPEQTINDSIGSHNPEFEDISNITFEAINNTAELVAHVKPFSITAKQTAGTAEHCTVTTDLSLAQQGGTLESGYCYFEWTNASQYTTNGFKLTGIPSAPGPLGVGYKISLFTESTNQKVVIDTHTFPLTAAAPIKPVITNYSIKVGDEWKENGSQLNHNPNDKLSAISVQVEARNYSQRLFIPELKSNCSIGEGDTSCAIPLKPIKLGHPSSNKEGEIFYTSYIDSDNDYWTGDNKVTTTIKANWLYMDTEIGGFHSNSMPGGYGRIDYFTLNDTEIEVRNNMAKLVISTPSLEGNGDWWEPASTVVITLYRKPVVTPINSDVELDGMVLYQKNDQDFPLAPRVSNSGAPQVVGDHLVYTYNLSNYKNGNYSPIALFSSKGGHFHQVKLPDVIINKTAPSIDVFRNGSSLTDNSVFYLADNLTIGAYNGFEDSMTIETVRLNGNTITPTILASTTALAKLPADVELIDGVNTFEITVKDGNNYRYSKTLKLIYSNPSIEFDISSLNGDLIQHVKQSTIEATVTKSSDYCSVVTNESLAIGSGHEHTGLCYFEWVGADELERKEFKLDGMFKSTQAITPIGYNIYTYLGANKVKTEIASKVVLFDVEAPIKPELASYGVFVGEEWIMDNEKAIHNPERLIQSFKVITNELNYTLKINFENMGACLINTGETECTIYVNPYDLGDPRNLGTSQGTASYAYSGDSANEYWGENSLKGNINVEWLYAPAQIEQFVANPIEIGGPKEMSVNVDGQAVNIEPNTAKVVVGHPVEDINGEWWLPKESFSLALEPSVQLEGVVRLIIEGHTLFRNEQSGIGDAYLLREYTGPEKVNGKYVYTFDIQNVPDGLYNVNATSVDTYKTESKHTFENALKVRRSDPQIGMFNSYNPLSDEEEFYFVSDLLVATFNGYKGGVSIESVTANGSSVTLQEVADGVMAISNLNTQLIPGEYVDIEVNVVTFDGFTSSKQFRLQYAPMQFEVKRKKEGYNPFRAVEFVDIETNQTHGSRCNFYADENTAQKYARNGRVSCLFNWKHLPDSFEVSRNSRSPSIFGYVNEKINVIETEIQVFNESGEQLTIPVESLVIETQEPADIELSLSSRKEVFEGFYTIEMSGGNIARVNSISSPGSISMDFEAYSSTLTEVKNPSSRTKDVFKTAHNYYLPDNLAHKLWDVVPVNVDVSYVRLPSISESQVINTLIIPDDSIGIDIDFQDDLILSTDEVTAKLQLGKYNRLDGWVYNADEMGEWDIYIGKYARKGIPEPVTDTVPLNAQGEAFIEMPMDLIGTESGIYVAVAKVKSPVPNFEHIIQSSRSYFIVYKGSKIDGELKNGTIRDRVPLRASINYSPKSTADRGSLGQVVWETSPDGVSWQEYPDSEGSLRWSKTYETEEIQYVRVKTENKFTGEWSTTDEVKVIAYEQPELILEQVNEVLDSEAAKFALFDGEEKLVGNEGTFEWSLDNRKTWVAGGAEEEYYKSDISSSNLYARMKYNGIASEAELNDKSFTEARIRYSFLRSPRIYFDTDAPKIVEVGSTHVITGTAFTRIESLNERVLTEWVLPSGEVVSGNELTLTFDEADLEGRYFNLTFQAWIEGAKDETMRSTRARISSWKYEFPDVTLTLPHTVKYAPSSMLAWVSVPRHYAPGVEYTYKLEPVAGVNVLKQEDNKFTLEYTKPGIVNVSFTVSNNRGDSRTLSQYVEVLPPQPLNVEIVSTFSNSFKRYPLDISLRARAALNHPEDRVELYRWYVDGKLISETRKFREVAGNLEVGKHTIKVEVQTDFGQTGEYEFDVTVIPNIKPTGTVKMTEADNYYELIASCDDTDGRILAVSWMLNNEQLAHGHSVIQFTKSKLSGTNTVNLKCYDDSGDYISVDQIIYAH
mgnify:FL=1